MRNDIQKLKCILSTYDYVDISHMINVNSEYLLKFKSIDDHKLLLRMLTQTLGIKSMIINTSHFTKIC